MNPYTAPPWVNTLAAWVAYGVGTFTVRLVRDTPGLTVHARCGLLWADHEVVGVWRFLRCPDEGEFPDPEATQTPREGTVEP